MQLHYEPFELYTARTQAARYETITYVDFITNILGSLEYTAEVQASLYN